VFQSYSLFPNMSALDNVAFGLRMRKQGAAARRARAGELLEMVGLTDQVQQYPHQLSGGQQQRVALARALAIEPSVLLLDEPLSALDAKVRLQLREQIRALQQRLHTTTLFVTHDQEEALSMADRVGVMRSGKLEQLATSSELYARPATAFVAEFVGTMNRIPGEADGDGRVRVLGRTLPITGDRPDGPLDALVRPEELRITAAPDGNGTAPGVNGTAPGANGTAPGANGTVTIATFLGSITRVHALLSGDVTVMVDVPSAESAALAPGTSVQVSVAEAEVLVTGRR
jgi:putative spermidine/putrescine transport system ATP-binding protein